MGNPVLVQASHSIYSKRLTLKENAARGDQARKVPERAELIDL
jgi:hypothetical protein